MNRFIILCVFVTLNISKEATTNVVHIDNGDQNGIYHEIDSNKDLGRKKFGFGRPIVPIILVSSATRPRPTTYTGSTSKDPIVFCYWGSWANLRPGDGAFGVQDLPTTLCTHIAYSFIDLTENGDLVFPEVYNVEGKSNSVEDFIKLKENNSQLKLLVAIGGWSAGSEHFSTVSHDDELRSNFVQNLVKYIEENDFDGLDVDWEYPGLNGGIETDKEAFVWLLRDLKNAFEPKNWLLTISVGVTEYHIETSYDVIEISRIVDYINLMTYDYNGVWSDGTGPNAPLFPDYGNDDGLTVDNSVQSWIDHGADRNKLVLGLAAYGRTFNLVDENESGTSAPFDGPGVAGPHTLEPGFKSYYEICKDQTDNPAEWQISEVNNSYVFGSRQSLWVGYDNNNTIYEKGIYARRQGLAGVMFWAVDLDDFNGLCGEEYALIRSSIEGYRNMASSVKFRIEFILIVIMSLLKIF